MCNVRWTKHWIDLVTAVSENVDRNNEYQMVSNLPIKTCHHLPYTYHTLTIQKPTASSTMAGQRMSLSLLGEYLCPSSSPLQYTDWFVGYCLAFVMFWLTADIRKLLLDVILDTFVGLIAHVVFTTKCCSWRRRGCTIYRLRDLTFLLFGTLNSDMTYNVSCLVIQFDYAKRLNTELIPIVSLARGFTKAEWLATEILPIEPSVGRL